MATARFGFLDHDGPIAYAHRGGSLELPENSMAAFAAAVELGFSYLETDARLTKDGHLVVLHDKVIDRVTDRRGAIAELTLEEVRRARLLGPDGEPSDERIPLLEDVFSVWPDAKINVDAKDNRSVEPLIELIRRTRSVDRVCVGAFSDKRLAAMRTALGAGLCTVLGPSDAARLRAASYGVPFLPITGAVAQLPVSYKVPANVPVGGGVRIPVIDRRLLAAARRRDIPVHVWTIDDATEMHRLLDLGVGGLMTDRPTVLRDVFVDRGHWPA